MRSRSTPPVSCRVTASASSAVSISGVVFGMQHALPEDRPLFRGSAFEVVILDRGDEPDVGVVEEGLEVGAAEGLARLALGVDRLADRGQVDRSEVADEIGISRPQSDLRRPPRLVLDLSAQNLAHCIADGDQAADDSGVFGWDAIRAFAVAYGDRLRLSADDLDQCAVVNEVAAFLDGRALGGRPDAERRRRRAFPSRGRHRLEEVARQTVERLREKVGERAGGREDGPARVDRPVGARGAGVVPKDHFGVLDEIAIDRERRLAAFGRDRFGEAVPGRAACCGSRIPLLQEEDVDHDVRSCCGIHCALRQTHRADQVRHRGDMRAGGLIDLVQGPARGDEGGEAAGPQALDRARDEIVVQGKAQLAGRIVGAHGAVRERRIADREIEDVRQARLGEILVPDAGVGIEELCDPGGHSVHLDAGQRQLARKRFRREGEEEARSATGLEHAPAVEAHSCAAPARWRGS